MTERLEPPEYFELSVRSSNILRNSGFSLDVKSTKSAVRRAIQNGKLELDKLRNCGSGAQNEIRIWCGLGSLKKYAPIPPHQKVSSVHRLKHIGKLIELLIKSLERDP